NISDDEFGDEVYKTERRNITSEKKKEDSFERELREQEEFEKQLKEEKKIMETKKLQEEKVQTIQSPKVTSPTSFMEEPIEEDFESVIEEEPLKTPEKNFASQTPPPQIIQQQKNVVEMNSSMSGNIEELIKLFKEKFEKPNDELERTKLLVDESFRERGKLLLQIEQLNNKIKELENLNSQLQLKEK